MTDGGDGTVNLVPSEKRKLACIKSNQERVWTEESKNKLRKFNSGKKQTSESNSKRSQTLKGRKVMLTYISCICCQKSTSLTNFIRWHKHC